LQILQRQGGHPSKPKQPKTTRENQDKEKTEIRRALHTLKRKSRARIIRKNTQAFFSQPEHSFRYPPTEPLAIQATLSRAMSTSDDVIKYARSELVKQQAKLVKRQQTLTAQIKTLESQASLHHFTGSVGSAPLKQFIQDQLTAIRALLSKQETTLENIRKELEDINRLLDSMPHPN
jgi:hypothetical protein